MRRSGKNTWIKYTLRVLTISAFNRALRTYGYDYVVIIEHEDPIMSIGEGFSKAVANLKSVNIKEKVADMWWA